MKVQLDPEDAMTVGLLAAAGVAAGGTDLAETATAPVAATSTTLLVANADRLKATVTNDTNGDLLISETGAVLTAITNAGTILHPGDSAVSREPGAITYFTAATTGLIRVTTTSKAA